MAAKMRHCFNCGQALGVYSDYDPLDTCGSRECEREAMRCVREYSETQKPRHYPES